MDLKKKVWVGLLILGLVLIFIFILLASLDMDDDHNDNYHSDSPLDWWYLHWNNIFETNELNNECKQKNCKSRIL